MRPLVVTPHFFGTPTPGEPYSHTSHRDQLAQALASLKRARSKLARALSAAVLAKLHAGKPG